MSMFLSCSCLPPEESLLEYTRNRHKPKRYEDRFINRMLSSLSARSQDFENDHSRPANKDMMRDRFRKSRIRKQVCFDYPPITSYHTRPRTASDERPDLFYTEDELDEWVHISIIQTIFILIFYGDNMWWMRNKNCCWLRSPCWRCWSYNDRIQRNPSIFYNPIYTAR